MWHGKRHYGIKRVENGKRNECTRERKLDRQNDLFASPQDVYASFMFCTWSGECYLQLNAAKTELENAFHACHVA